MISFTIFIGMILLKWKDTLAVIYIIFTSTHPNKEIALTKAGICCEAGELDINLFSYFFSLSITFWQDAEWWKHFYYFIYFYLFLLTFVVPSKRCELWLISDN